MSNSNDPEKWRRFLQPVVTGLVELMAAATLYIKRQGSDDMESRVDVLDN